MLHAQGRGHCICDEGVTSEGANDDGKPPLMSDRRLIDQSNALEKPLSPGGTLPLPAGALGQQLRAASAAVLGTSGAGAGAAQQRSLLSTVGRWGKPGSLGGDVSESPLNPSPSTVFTPSHPAARPHTACVKVHMSAAAFGSSVLGGPLSPVAGSPLTRCVMSSGASSKLTGCLSASISLSSVPVFLSHKTGPLVPLQRCAYPNRSQPQR